MKVPTRFYLYERQLTLAADHLAVPQVREVAETRMVIGEPQVFEGHGP